MTRGGRDWRPVIRLPGDVTAVEYRGKGHEGLTRDDMTLKNTDGRPVIHAVT